MMLTSKTMYMFHYSFKYYVHAFYNLKFYARSTNMKVIVIILCT
jgi:hypothetical protein